MTALTSKVCIVGDFAVGKTSVVERFVNNQFSEKYLTTVGVKVDTKEIDLPDHGTSIKLVLWDVAGSDTFGPREFAYLRGAAGFIFVADGTRSLTIATAEKLRGEIVERAGERPVVMLLNKHDLNDAWEVSDSRLGAVEKKFGVVYRTSAKSGENVEAALTRLAEMIVDRALAAS